MSTAVRAAIPQAIPRICSTTTTWYLPRAARVRDRIRQEARLTDTVTTLVHLYEAVMHEQALRPADPSAELLATGAYLQTLDCILKGQNIKPATARA